jgi:hypothetical protein
MEEDVADVGDKKRNIFFVLIAIVIACIGALLILYDIYMMFKEGKPLSSNFLLGLTLLYESLMVSQGIVPRVKA